VPSPTAAMSAIGKRRRSACMAPVANDPYAKWNVHRSRRDNVDVTKSTCRVFCRKFPQCSAMSDAV
jgi:hypothetical protein